MAVYQVGQSEYEIPDEVQGAQLQGVLEGLARQETGTQEPQMPKSQFLAENLPEIGESPELNELSKSGFLSSLASLSITDPIELGSALSEQVPGSFVSTDPEGNPLINFPSGTFAINKPGISGQDVAQFGFRAAAFTPVGRANPLVAGGAGLTGPLKQRAATVGARSAVLEGGLQAGEELIGGEFDVGETVGAGVFGVAGEGVTSILSPIARTTVNKIKALKRRRAEVKQGFERGGSQEAIRRAQEVGPAQRETGIKLTRAQQTQEPALLQEQSFIGDLPEGSKRALQFLTKQNEQAGTAVQNFLNSIAPPSSVVTGPRRLRTAAQEAVELRKTARREATSPLYNDAFDDFRRSGQVLDATSVLDEITLRASMFPDSHPAAKTLKLFAKEIQNNADDLGKLHGVKEVIDTRIANLTTGKSTAATNKASREAVEVQRSLVALMEDASPQYRNARQEFIRQSGPVTEITEGSQSIIGRIADLDDKQLKDVSRILFDPTQTNPEVLRQAKRIIRRTDGGHDSWNQIVRNEFERRMGSAKNELNAVISGDVNAIQNIPSNLINALGMNNIKNKRVIRQALSPAQRRNFDFLETALKRASTGRPGGSPTATREEIKKRLDKGIISGIRKWMRGPLTTVTEIGEEGARSARIRAMSDAIFDDAWSPQLAEVRALQASGRMTQAEDKMFELLNKVERASVSRGLIQATRSEE